MKPRLAAGVEASALIRRVSSQGGFATLIAKGDAERGSLMLIVTTGGRHCAILERLPAGDGDYCWKISGPAESKAATVGQWLARRRSFDRDLWLIELDVPSPQRFIAETLASG